MNLFLLMLIIINPFSQALYLRELFDQLDFKQFIAVHIRATVYSLIILGIFAVVGEPVMKHVFQVRLGSLQVFGGLVNLWVAYRFITNGEGSSLLFKGNVADLAPNITLPYMVGAGVLWVSILMGRSYPIHFAWGMIAGVLAINFFFIMACCIIFQRAPKNTETTLSKYLGLCMRVMALFIGAIGVEMIFGGAAELLGG